MGRELFYMSPILGIGLLLILILATGFVWLLRVRKEIYSPKKVIEVDRGEVKKILVNELLLARDREKEAEEIVKLAEEDKTLPLHKLQTVRKSLKQKTEIRIRTQKKLLSI
jgi:hypothetical protein